MGTWGHSITSDDTVADVIDEFVNQLKEGRSSREAFRNCEKKFADIVRDDQIGPLFWLAIGEAQWRYGAVDPKVLRQIKRDLTEKRGLECYETEAGKRKRIKIIARFIEKIENDRS